MWCLCWDSQQVQCWLIGKTFSTFFVFVAFSLHRVRFESFPLWEGHTPTAIQAGGKGLYHSVALPTLHIITSLQLLRRRRCGRRQGNLLDQTIWLLNWVTFDFYHEWIGRKLSNISPLFYKILHCGIELGGGKKSAMISGVKELT